MSDQRLIDANTLDFEGCVIVGRGGILYADYLKMMRIIGAAPTVPAVVPPCKVGDVVWHVEYDEFADAYDIVGDIFVTANDEIVLCAPRPYGFDGSISQYILIQSEENENCAELNVYKRNNCYVAREEAEAALRAQDGEHSGTNN